MSGPEYQIVVSFRVQVSPNFRYPEKYIEGYEQGLRELLSGEQVADLDVAVRVIGASGERGADEGRWDNAPPSHGPGTPKGAV